MSLQTSKEPLKVKGLSFYDADGNSVMPEYRGRQEAGAWFGDEFLKRRTVESMEKHREDDRIVQGFYQAGLLIGDEVDFQFQGCLVGCTLPPMSGHYMDGLSDSMYWEDGDPWHHLVERFYNIPAAIAAALDNEFENTFREEAPEFAVNALMAIPVGAVYAQADIEAFWDRDDMTSEDLLRWLANPTRIAEQS